MNRFKVILLSILLSQSVTAQVNCPPHLPLTLLGNTQYCIGSPGAELSVQQTYIGYEWLPTAETSQNVLLTAGNYQLVVTHYTGCTDTLEIEVEQVSNPPQPTVTANGPTEFCEGGSVTLSGPTGYPYYLWNTGSISEEITVLQSGVFVLSVIDWLGCSSSSNSIAVTVNPLPTAIFSPDINEYQVEFNNLSLDASDYHWNFGDGSTSQDFEPTHNYSIDGMVDMYLVASNDCGSDTAFLNMTSVSVNEVKLISEFSVYPNPATDYAILEFNSTNSETMNLTIYNMMGELVLTNSFQAQTGRNLIRLNTQELSAGMYLAVLTSESNIASVHIQISK
ncbi:MAG: T9SS type A sorting domain-containing protein [Flavobacteriales bacterium]|nr:T9SS type A sorting domain-containing protein [Flavobacteriales bacterium]